MENERRDFDKGAAEWDEKPERVKLANDVAQTILARVALGRDMDVLDFGCGTGLVTLNLQPRVRSVTGVDTSAGMLEVLRSKVEKQGIANVETRLLDLEKGDSLEGPFHAVVSSMALHHVPDTGAILRRFHGLLAPGGILALADLDLDGGNFHSDNHGVFHHGFNRKALKEAFEKAGFGEVRDWNAAEALRKGPDGRERKFTVFLMVGRKRSP